MSDKDQQVDVKRQDKEMDHDENNIPFLNGKDRENPKIIPRKYFFSFLAFLTFLSFVVFGGLTIYCCLLKDKKITPQENPFEYPKQSQDITKDITGHKETQIDKSLISSLDTQVQPQSVVKSGSIEKEKIPSTHHMKTKKIPSAHSIRDDEIVLDKDDQTSDDNQTSVNNEIQKNSVEMGKRSNLSQKSNPSQKEKFQKSTDIIANLNLQINRTKSQEFLHNPNIIKTDSKSQGSSSNTLSKGLIDKNLDRHNLLSNGSGSSLNNDFSNYMTEDEDSLLSTSKTGISWPPTSFDDIKKKYNILNFTHDKRFLSNMTKIQRIGTEKLYFLKSIEVKDDARILEEIKMWKETSNPYIIKLHEYFQIGTKYYIIMEHFSDKTLLTHDEEIEEKHVKRIASQLYIAISHLHESGMVHHAIKRETVFLRENGTSFDIKLVGFCLNSQLKLKNRKMENSKQTVKDWRGYGTLLFECIINRPYKRTDENCNPARIKRYSLMIFIMQFIKGDDRVETDISKIRPYLDKHCKLEEYEKIKSLKRRE